MAVSEKPWTLEDFLALPEKKPALELEDGQIKKKPLPKGKHSTLQRFLVDAFQHCATRFRMWACLLSLPVPEIVRFRAFSHLA